MSTLNLKVLFQPKSVAVVGASTKAKTPGAVVMRNLLQGGFAGPVMPITAEHASVAGVLAYPDVPSLPMTPDLAVICSPPQEVPGIIRALGEKGTRAVCVVCPNMNVLTNAAGETLLAAALQEAKPFKMRILGPHSIGFMVPGIGLNASFAPENALRGKIAFVSQSAAVCTAVLDWACSKNIGFSHFIHTGGAVDVGIDDILDYLGSDPHTRAILLYIETLRSRRNFMSAARAAARNKPVLLIKGGRSRKGGQGGISHAGALAGSDLVFDAAIRRAGMLRVEDIDALFGSVETLARSRPMKGTRLAILTNGGGIGTLAADDLIDGGGQLAELPSEVIEKIKPLMPSTWIGRNPINIFGDADGARYAKVLQVLLESKAIDATLVMHAPTATSDPDEIAEAVIKIFKEKTRANIMTCWVGSAQVAHARKLFAETAVPTFDTPHAAVQGFLHVLEYRRNQELLMEVPASAPSDFVPDTGLVRRVISDVMARGDTTLTEAEAKTVLAAYGIPTVETRIAATPEEANRLSKDFNGPVALKILSTDIVHKSDVGGVVLGLEGGEEVEKAAVAMLGRIKIAYPEARIEGFTVQKMAIRRPGTQELIIGVATDPIFGPVIVFGQGGVAVEVIGDRAVALPPLNMNLASELVQRTRVAALLKEYRGRPAANINAVHLALIQVSQLIIDVPEIVELDINPLRCDTEGVLALDAAIKVTPVTRPNIERLAICPYPAEQEEIFTMKDGTGRKVLLRPIRPEDEPNHHILVSRLTPEDVRFRFFGLVQQLPHTEMARLTQIDYNREMAFIGEYTDPEGKTETLGVVRTICDSENDKAEFAVLVRSDLKGSGLGKRLLVKMMEYCRDRGTKHIVGQVLKDNIRMLRFVEYLGYVQTKTVDGDIVEVEYDLKKPITKTPEPTESA